MAIKDSLTKIVTHEGLVLDVNARFILDTHADEVIVWNATEECPEIVVLMGQSAYAQIDASLEVRSAYNEYRAKERARMCAEREEQRLQEVQIGSTVQVVRGRGLAKGTVGVVKAIYPGPNYITLVLEGGGRTYQRNVEVLYRGAFVVPRFTKTSF